jgi:methylated-DNA-protein-cysteine methyltransferase-like protein
MKKMENINGLAGQVHREGSFQQRVVALIKKIPRGRVATYGQIALLAGNHRAARQVAWALHSSAVKENLPWHRVINSRGFISLKPGAGFELQRTILSGEGIVFSSDGSVDLAYYLWKPKRSDHL